MSLSLDRPDWWDRASCRGMGKRFTEAKLDVQLAMCTACPVMWQCAESVERWPQETDVYSNVLTFGGMDHVTLRKWVLRRRRARKADEAVDRAEARRVEAERLAAGRARRQAERSNSRDARKSIVAVPCNEDVVYIRRDA